MIHIQVAAVVSVNDGRLVKIQRALHFMRVIQDRERFKPSVWKIQYAEILRPKQSSRSMRVYEPRGTSCCRGDSHVYAPPPLPVRLVSSDSRSPIAENQDMDLIAGGDVAGDGSSASEGFIVRVGNNDKD